MYRYNNCDQCGCNYRSQRKSITGANYCTNACKQKAYRARKKQEKIAKQQTMTMGEYQVLTMMNDRYENFQETFDGLKDDYGLQVAVDFMFAVSALRVR